MVSSLCCQDESNRLETIGNGWKTIFARLENVKSGKTIDDLGESIKYGADVA